MKDADGMTIRLGSVLRNIHDGDQGVVVRVMKYGDVGIRHLDAVGDIHIQSGPGSFRVTNKYHLWRHVPRAQQSFRERYLSWFKDPDAYQYNCLDDREGLTDADRKAITGIMALLPEEIVDWEAGPWPDTVEDALRFLVGYLSSPNMTGRQGGGSVELEGNVTLSQPGNRGPDEVRPPDGGRSPVGEQPLIRRPSGIG